jgi:hypothetical protein
VLLFGSVSRWVEPSKKPPTPVNLVGWFSFSKKKECILEHVHLILIQHGLVIDVHGPFSRERYQRQSTNLVKISESTTCIISICALVLLFSIDVILPPLHVACKANKN